MENAAARDRLEKLAELQKAILRFKRDHAIYDFRPANDEQKTFLLTPAHTSLAIGSNRSGKTHTGTYKDVAYCYGFFPHLLPPDLKKKQIEEVLKIRWEDLPPGCRTPKKPPVRGLIVAEDWEKADEIFVTGAGGRSGKLSYFISPGSVKGAPEKNGLGYTCKWNFINGSILSIETEKSFINNPKSFEGGSYDFLHLDEPKKRDLYIALARGLVDTRGYCWFTFTPWNVEPWVYDDLVVKAASNKDIFICQLSTEKNPHVDQAGWQAYLDTLTEDERLARGRGQFIHLRGLVYPEFSAKAYKDGGNIIPVRLSPKWLAENSTIYISIDPHPRQPQTAVFLAADGKDRLIVFDEIFKKMLIPDLVKAIKEKLAWVEKGQDGILPFEMMVIDPIAFNEDPIDGRKWADEFHAAGLPVQPASKRKEAGIARTRQLFKDRRLLVTRNCARVIWELQHYIYSEWNDSRSRNEKERPVDRDDHTMECLYRLVLLEPERVKPRASAPIKASYCP